MLRISGPTTVDIGGGRAGFIDENLGTAQEGTDVSAAFLNQMQEEVAQAIELLGISLSGASDQQLLRAMRRLAGANVTTFSANASLTADHAGLVMVSAAAGNVVLTLPAATAAGASPIPYDIVRTDAVDANSVTIQRAGSDLIEGAISILVPVSRRMRLRGDGVSAWRIMGQLGVNRAYAEYINNTNLSTAIPVDDTIPQVTEGTQILSVAIQPRSTTSRVRVQFNGQGGCDSVGTLGITAALFLNGGANAVRAAVVTVPGNGNVSDFNLVYEHVPGSLAVQTYTLRVGPQSGIMRMNGSASGRYLGGAASATLIAEEIT